MQHVHNDEYTSFYGPRIGGLLTLWFAAALAFVASGALARAPAFALPASITLLTFATLVVLWGTAPGRAWSGRLSLAMLAWFHVWRVVPGVAFLVLHAQGALPWGFAVPGGIGDVAVGVVAPLAAWLGTKVDSRSALAGYVALTVLGIVDLANVVRAALILSLHDPASMHLLRQLPLGLLPTFAVPITFAAHALALHRAGSAIFRRT